MSPNSSQTALSRDSAALRRLMEEVRCEDSNVSSASTAYNRQHNRHNR
ncbi:YhhA family cyclophane-containing RiPP [Granulicella mallensis]